LSFVFLVAFIVGLYQLNLAKCQSIKYISGVSVCYQLEVFVVKISVTM